MTLVPDPAMWSWLPGSLPRVVLIARLSRKTRPTIQHDWHIPMPVVTRFLHELGRLSCKTLTETPSALLVVIALPIQAP